MRELLALPLREKLEVVEEMSDLAERFAQRRVDRDTPPTPPAADKLPPP